MLLFNLRTSALTAGALALVSLLALEVDPSAQQILSFDQRIAKLTNTTANIGVATSYFSKAYKKDMDGSTGSKYEESRRWTLTKFRIATQNMTYQA
jgi:hypothetical protein